MDTDRKPLFKSTTFRRQYRIALLQAIVSAAILTFMVHQGWFSGHVKQLYNLYDSARNGKSLLNNGDGALQGVRGQQR
jgi:hypothetical protein